MQSFALDSVELFAFASDFLKKNHRYEVETTHTGATVCVSPKGDDAKKRSLFLLGPDKDACRQNIFWVYKNLHPQALISVGFSDACGTSEAQSDDKTPALCFVPATCLRSAGNTQFGGNPVLFEEIPFESSLQKKIATTLEILPQGHLFGSDRPLKKKDDLAWLWSNLDCMSWDQYTSELLLAGKRLHCPIGCVKLFGSEDTNRKKLLLQTVEKLML